MWFDAEIQNDATLWHWLTTCAYVFLQRLAFWSMLLGRERVLEVVWTMFKMNYPDSLMVEGLDDDYGVDEPYTYFAAICSQNLWISQQ